MDYNPHATAQLRHGFNTIIRIFSTAYVCKGINQDLLRSVFP